MSGYCLNASMYSSARCAFGLVCFNSSPILILTCSSVISKLFKSSALIVWHLCPVVRIMSNANFIESNLNVKVSLSFYLRMLTLALHPM